MVVSKDVVYQTQNQNTSKEEDKTLKIVSVFVVKKHKNLTNVLLGERREKYKRAFGHGKINGAGGKVKDGESFAGAARRETREEFGINPTDLELAAVVNIDRIHHGKRKPVVMRVYTAQHYEGRIHGSKEMAKPKWYRKQDIPFEKMYEEYKFLLKRVLKGENLIVDVRYDDKQKMSAIAIKTADGLRDAENNCEKEKTSRWVK